MSHRDPAAIDPIASRRSSRRSSTPAPGIGRPRASRVLLVLALAAAGGAAVAPAPVAAQSAEEILSDAMERHEARLAGVENVTIRQEVMGIPSTMYMVKEIVDGHATLRPVEGEVTGQDMDFDEEINDLWSSPHEFYVGLGDRWSLDGQGSIDGRESWMLSITDLDDVEWGAAGQEGEFHPSRVELQLSRDDLVPLEMTMDGEMDVEGQLRPVSLRMLFTDYREVDGYLHPFVMTMETQMPTEQMSEEELEEARRALEEIKTQLEQAPAAQREMMERMMGDQIGMLEDLVAGEGIQVEMRVTELLVNAGPPEG